MKSCRVSSFIAIGLVALVTSLSTTSLNAASNNSVQNMIEGKAYLQENGLNPGVISLASGLQYKILKKGTGRTPKRSDSVKVHYTGTFINGTEFDSSRSEGSKPAEFKVTGVIKGWTQALLMMKEGAHWQLAVPADIAYGDQDRPGIPAHSVLLFDVELVKIVSPFKQ